MIKEIKLKSIVPFDDQEVKGLKKVNLIFGVNASGKSTLADLILNPHKSSYQDCSIQTDNEMDVVLYDMNYWERSFLEEGTEEGTVAGVFRHVQDPDPEIAQRVRELEKERDSVSTSLNDNNEKLNDLKTKKKQLENDFKGNNGLIWLQKNSFSQLEAIYKELNWVGKAATVADYVLKNQSEEFDNGRDSNSINIEADSLLKKWENLKEPETVNMPISIDKIKSINLPFKIQELLSHPIIGQSEFSISKLIDKLDSSNWIRSGIKYFEHAACNESICPFCQQGVPDSIASELKSLFKGVYEDQIRELKQYKNAIEEEQEIFLKDNYETELKDLSSKLQGDGHTHELLSNWSAVKSSVETIVKLLDDKISDPSSIKVLPEINGKNDINLSEVLQQLQSLVNEHNDRIKKIGVSKNECKDNVKKFIANLPTVKNAVVKHKRERKNIDDEISTFESKVSKQNSKLRCIKKELTDLSIKLEGTEQVLQFINSTLLGIGFTNFTLELTPDKKYKVIRKNREDAIRTMSEGEKSFLGFLYFYYQYLDQENSNSNEDGKPKIVLLDDPMSSLDQNTWWHTISLIRKCVRSMERTKNGVIDNLKVNQLFILTHNFQFFRKALYSTHRNKAKLFSIVRQDQGSIVEVTKPNITLENYDLLWNLIRDDPQCTSINTTNAMRQIIESYFGAVYRETAFSKIMYQIEEKEMQGKINMPVVLSLLFLLNSTSHGNELLEGEESYVGDGIPYEEMFRFIFEVTGQIDHYELCMGNQHPEEAENS